MGTPTCKIFKHRGRYFQWRRHYLKGDEFWEEIYDMILEGKETPEQWAENMRQKLDVCRTWYLDMLAKGEGDENRIVRTDDDEMFTIVDRYEDCPPSDSANHAVDLDTMVFLDDGYPLYHLNNMPPKKIFCRSRDDVEMASGNFYYNVLVDTPEEYRFDIVRLEAPAVEDEQLLTYERLIAGVVAAPHEILSLQEHTSSCEELCLCLLLIYAFDLTARHLGELYREFAFARNRSEASWKTQEMAITMAALALLPAHGVLTGRMFFGRDRDAAVVHPEAAEEVWFIRKHICFSLVTRLHSERTVKYHISRLVDHVMATPDAPDIVYGVLFSLFHCMVVRVDKKANGSFIHTEVLEFMPPYLSDFQIAPPGMVLLVRLGNLRAPDDIEFFYSCLSPRWWVAADQEPDGETDEESTDEEYSTDEESNEEEYITDEEESTDEEYITDEEESTDEEEDMPVRKKCKISHPDEGEMRPAVESAVDHGPPRLPSELFFTIAQNIDGTMDLFNFALGSRATMAAAIPSMRFPQTIALDFIRCGSKLSRNGYILRSFLGYHLRFGSLSGCFETSYDGRPIFILFSMQCYATTELPTPETQGTLDFRRQTQQFHVLSIYRQYNFWTWWIEGYAKADESQLNDLSVVPAYVDRTRWKFFGCAPVIVIE